VKSTPFTLFVKETGGRSDSSSNGLRKATPPFPRLRSSDELSQRPSPQKQFPRSQLAALGDFLTALQNTKEEGETRLDRSMVLYGTCMGSANLHSTVNLPMRIAADGFKHGQHLAFDTVHNDPVAHLHLSMLHRLSIEAKALSTSKGAMRELELA